MIQTKLYTINKVVTLSEIVLTLYITSFWDNRKNT